MLEFCSFLMRRLFIAHTRCRTENKFTVYSRYGGGSQGEFGFRPYRRAVVAVVVVRLTSCCWVPRLPLDNTWQQIMWLKNENFRRRHYWAVVACSGLAKPWWGIYRFRSCWYCNSPWLQRMARHHNSRNNRFSDWLMHISQSNSSYLQYSRMQNKIVNRMAKVFSTAIRRTPHIEMETQKMDYCFAFYNKSAQYRV